MKQFFMEMVSGEAGRISSVRCMSWFVLVLIAVSWFVFPERSVAELAAIYGALLGAAVGGKWSFNKHVKGTLTPEGE